MNWLSCFFGFPPANLHPTIASHSLLPTPAMHDSPIQAQNYHISNPALGLLNSQEGAS
jgi:hypothetical protein